jgi:hypothetical protein
MDNERKIKMNKISEKKLEEIRVFLSWIFPNAYKTTESALDIVIENFYDRHNEGIKEANKCEESK